MPHEKEIELPTMLFVFGGDQFVMDADVDEDHRYAIHLKEALLMIDKYVLQFNANILPSPEFKFNSLFRFLCGGYLYKGGGGRVIYPDFDLILSICKTKIIVDIDHTLKEKNIIDSHKLSLHKAIISQLINTDLIDLLDTLYKNGIIELLREERQLYHTIELLYETAGTSRVDFCFVAHGAPIRDATSLELYMEGQVKMLRYSDEGQVKEGREIILSQHLRKTKEKGLFLFLQSCYGSGFLGYKDKEVLDHIFEEENITFISFNPMDDTSGMGDDRRLCLFNQKIKAYFEKRGKLHPINDRLYFQSTSEWNAFCATEFPNDVFLREHEWLFFDSEDDLDFYALDEESEPTVDEGDRSHEGEEEEMLALTESQEVPPQQEGSYSGDERTKATIHERQASKTKRKANQMIPSDKGFFSCKEEKLVEDKNLSIPAKKPKRI